MARSGDPKSTVWAHTASAIAILANLLGLLAIIFFGGRWMGTTDATLETIEKKVSSISTASGEGDLRHDGEIRRALDKVSQHDGRFETLEMKIEGSRDRIEMKVDGLEQRVEMLEQKRG